MRRCEKRYVALFALLTVWAGCAGTAPSSTSAPQSETRAKQAIKEEFDPRSLREDLLLIQPVFPRPDLGEPDTTPAQEVPEVGIVRPDPVPEWENFSERVYRVQIMAIDNEEIARERLEELEKTLGVPVYVEPQRHLFVVRVGDFHEREEANLLKDKLVRLHSDYEDAYVIVFEQQRSIPVPAPAVEQTPPPEEPVESKAPEPVLVSSFGWRVLLDQFLTNDDAVKLKNRAMRRLKRKDIAVTFKAPWYKVELGNFRTEAEAQQWVELSKGKGYGNALKLRAQILVPREER